MLEKHQNQRCQGDNRIYKWEFRGEHYTEELNMRDVSINVIYKYKK